MRRLPLTLLPLLLAACERQPVAPDHALHPEFAATSGGASSTWTRGSILVDAIGFVDCLGEDGHFFGEERFILHEVTSASGVTQSFFQFSPITPSGPQFSLQLLTSGKLYQLKDGLPINQVFQFGPDSTFSYREKDVYVNVADKFDKVTFTFRNHITLNANGEVTADRSNSILCGSH